MNAKINLYSDTNGEIQKFLNLYYSNDIKLNNNLFWEKNFQDPINMIDIISCFIDNNHKYKMNLWISLDKDIFICVTENNLNSVIKYLYERYPN